MGTSHELVPKPSLIETNLVLAYFLRSGTGLPTRSRDSLAADNPGDHAAEPLVKEVDSGRLVEPVALNAERGEAKQRAGKRDPGEQLQMPGPDRRGA
jgi:hypothetical protein